MTAAGLELVGRRAAGIAEDARVLLCAVRNEALRLPYLLGYYRALGFDRLVFIDNASTDGTRELLLEQKDTVVFHAEGHFGAPPGAGLPWKHAVLDRFCDGRWVLVADADELLVWPGSESENIRTLTEKLDARGAKLLFALMLDMYSDKPFDRIGYRAGEPFLDYAPYFDPGPYSSMRADYCPFVEVWGGVRARIWKGEDPRFHPPMIGKVPLLRWHAGQRFVAAQHMIETPLPLAAMRGALLHFKMLDDLPAKCAFAIETGEYYRGSREYRVLAAAIERSPAKSFFDPAISVRYRGTDQLVSLRLMAP